MSTNKMNIIEATFDSWARHNEAMVNLLRLLPPDGLRARIFSDSRMVCEMFSHMHHERLVSVLENAPECAIEVPAVEWQENFSVDRLAGSLEESAKCVASAVRGRIESGRQLDLDFAHPVQLLHFLILHEGYHHGQIKSALKSMGQPLPDEPVRAQIWEVWRRKNLTGLASATGDPSAEDLPSRKVDRDKANQKTD